MRSAGFVGDRSHRCGRDPRQETRDAVRVPRLLVVRSRRPREARQTIAGPLALSGALYCAQPEGSDFLSRLVGTKNAPSPEPSLTMCPGPGAGRSATNFTLKPPMAVVSMTAGPLGVSTCSPTSKLSVRCFRSSSYTHLRAHETDSSLVCRLLLE